MRRNSSIEGESEADPIFALIRAHREAQAEFVEVDDVLPDDSALRKRLLRAEEEAFDRLRETAPSTLAGARAIIEYMVEYDEANIPQTSGEYMRTLLRSPIFAVEEARA